jgi:hypothetical protein
MKERYTDPDTLGLLNLAAFPIHQQIVLGSLVEEIAWLKERVAWLERQASPLAPAPDAPQEEPDENLSSLPYYGEFGPGAR